MKLHNYHMAEILTRSSCVLAAIFFLDDGCYWVFQLRTRQNMLKLHQLQASTYVNNPSTSTEDVTALGRW